jgi:acetolactate synthase small subunit
MEQEEPAWLFSIRVADRPGALAAIASVFAHRGVSLTSAMGQDAAEDPEARGTVVVTFCATPKRKQELQRVLQRLPRVFEVRDYAYRDPMLRKAALVRARPGAALDREPPPPLAVERIGEKEEAEIYLIAGPPADVDTWLTTLRASGAILSTVQAAMAV